MAIYASRAFKLYSDDKLVTFGNSVYQLMFGVTKYMILKLLIDDIRVRNDAFIAAITVANRGSEKQTDEKNAAKANFNKLLEKIAHKLEDLAEENGDNPDIITDAGYDLRATKGKSSKTPVTELNKPTNFVALNLEKTGYVKLNWKESLHAINYAIRFKQKSETVWQNGIFCDKKEYVLTNLLSDTVYEFEVCAVGPNGLTSEYAATTPVYVS